MDRRLKGIPKNVEHAWSHRGKRKCDMPGIDKESKGKKRKTKTDSARKTYSCQSGSIYREFSWMISSQLTL